MESSEAGGSRRVVAVRDAALDVDARTGEDADLRPVHELVLDETPP
jgi:hypothetical protein